MSEELKQRNQMVIRALETLCLIFFGVVLIGYVLQDIFYSLYFSTIGFIPAIVGSALFAFWNIFWYIVGMAFGLFYPSKRLKLLLLLGSAIIFIAALLSDFVFPPMAVLTLSIISNCMVIPSSIFVFIVIREEQKHNEAIVG